MAVKGKAEITISDILDGKDGAAGKGIKSVTNYYLASASGSGVTASTSGWTTTVQTITASKKYLWNYEKITYTDNSTSSTSPCIIGVYGDKGQTGNTGATGATGNGIKSITEYYQISTSNTTAPTSWLTTVPTLTATNKYLWNYEKITYTNGTSVDTAKRVIGVYGDKGNTGATGPAGKGIKSTAITYQASTSGTTAPTGTWGASVPSVPQGQYLWSRTVITYTDNSTSTTYSVAYIPKNGQNGATGSTGATGTGVASIVQQYYLSTSKTTQTGGSWVTSMPTWSSGKYLWTRYQINYKNPTSTAYTSPICDSSWEAVNEIQIGGRNLATKTSSEYTKPYTSFSGEPYITIFTGGTILIDDLNVGDTVTIRLICKYTDIVSVSGQTAAFLFQGKGDVTGWDRGSFYSSPNNMSGTGEAELLYSFSINETHLKNTHWITSIRFDYVQSGSIQYKMLKAEKGNRATDWTPAPEDVQADIDEAAKTATNYMNFDNNGLVIGDLTKGTLGRSVLIDSDSVDIRNGDSVLATFSDNLIELGKGGARSSVNLYDGTKPVASFSNNLIELGKGSPNSSIEMCDKAGVISVDASSVSGTGYDLLKLKTSDDIGGLSLQSTIVTLRQPPRSASVSSADLTVYGDLPVSGNDNTSSYIQAKARNGGGGEAHIGLYAEKRNGTYDENMNLKLSSSSGGTTSVNITKGRIGIVVPTSSREMVFNDRGITLQENNNTSSTSINLRRLKPDGSMWVYGRDFALISDGYDSRATSDNYRPLASSRSSNGSWDIGTFNDELHLSYVSDTRHNSENNGRDAYVIFPNSGYYTYGKNKILWSGAAYMHADQTIELSDYISNQSHGIALIWSRYINGSPVNERFNSFFIPKQWAFTLNGFGMNFDLSGNFNYATKYVYINDGYLRGQKDNNAVINAADGSIWKNNEHVLRFVIGL